MTSSLEDETFDRVHGCFLGLACGDRFGRGTFGQATLLSLSAADSLCRVGRYDLADQAAALTEAVLGTTGSHRRANAVLTEPGPHPIFDDATVRAAVELRMHRTSNGERGRHPLGIVPFGTTHTANMAPIFRAIPLAIAFPPIAEPGLRDTDISGEYLSHVFDLCMQSHHDIVAVHAAVAAGSAIAAAIATPRPHDFETRRRCIEAPYRIVVRRERMDRFVPDYRERFLSRAGRLSDLYADAIVLDPDRLTDWVDAQGTSPTRAETIVPFAVLNAMSDECTDDARWSLKLGRCGHHADASALTGAIAGALYGAARIPTDIVAMIPEMVRKDLRNVARTLVRSFIRTTAT